MDPLIIFYDINELIIQHFNFKDIFELYKVSKSWHSLILNDSKHAMSKILLHVEESNHDEVMSMLQNKTSQINNNLLDLLNTTRKYQNIKIHVDHGWDYIDQLVRNLASSLVDIEVSSDIFMENVKISTLKFLKLDNPLLEGLTTCSNKLKKLSATVSGNELWIKRESPIAIKNALRVNKDLEILEIDEILTGTIFESNISSDIKFHLNEISLKCSNTFDEQKFSNIREFLSKQHRIELMTIELLDPFTIQWIYENLKQLKSLKIKVNFEQNPRDFYLKANESITKLDMNITSNWQYTMNIKFALRAFIAASPNLETLIIRMMSLLELDDFRFLLFNARKLKKVIQNVDDCLSTYREIYEQMRSDHENISETVEFEIENN